MSLFASLGQGDIWSISGISFGSPINDILDGESFTLEQLLQEDELLQELKSRNGRLVDFLSAEETIGKLIDYTIVPAPADEGDLVVFKYPYMSCEVMCMEIPEILQMLVQYSEGKFLRKLFDLLDSSTSLDNHLAGYFEKILEMLFRKETEAIISHINASGAELFRKFLQHIDNYSIMQIVQRLMLPHIPFSITAEADPLVGDNLANQQCQWSFSEQICSMLCDRMLEQGCVDVSAHISDLLITVVQLSPPDALIISNLCESRCLDRLLQAAFAVESELGVLEEKDVYAQSDKGVISLAAISVLESLISRLSESLVPFEEGDSTAGKEEEFARIVAVTKKCIEHVCESLLPFLPYISAQLAEYVDKNPCGDLTVQSKEVIPRLGHRALQLIKLIEAMVRLGDQQLDRELSLAGVFKSAVDLVFFFRTNSLLHLSVQRVLLMIVEGGETKRFCQAHVFGECKLLERIIKFLSTSDEGETFSNASVNIVSSSRSPLRGHLIVVAQAILNSIVVEECENKSERCGLDPADGGAEAPAAADPAEGLQEMPVLEPENRMQSGEASKEQAENQAIGEVKRFKDMVLDCIPADEWEAFVEDVLSKHLEKQAANLNGEDFDVGEDEGPVGNVVFSLNGQPAMPDGDVMMAAMDDDDDEDDDDDVDPYSTGESIPMEAGTGFGDFADFSDVNVSFQADFSQTGSLQSFADFPQSSPPMMESFAAFPQTSSEAVDSFADFSQAGMGTVDAFADFSAFDESKVDGESHVTAQKTEPPSAIFDPFENNGRAEVLDDMANLNLSLAKCGGQEGGYATAISEGSENEAARDGKSTEVLVDIETEAPES